MKHTVKVISKLTEHPGGHGVVFILSCCGKHEASHHIQNPGLYTAEELLRVKRDLMAEHARKHHSHLRALETLATKDSNSLKVDLD